MPLKLHSYSCILNYYISTFQKLFKALFCLHLAVFIDKHCGFFCPFSNTMNVYYGVLSSTLWALLKWIITFKGGTTIRYIMSCANRWSWSSFCRPYFKLSNCWAAPSIITSLPAELTCLRTGFAWTCRLLIGPNLWGCLSLALWSTCHCFMCNSPTNNQYAKDNQVYSYYFMQSISSKAEYRESA